MLEVKGGKKMQLLIITFIIHLALSILCLSRCKKKTSYVVEIVLSLILITYQFYLVDFKEIPDMVVFCIVEYIIAKIAILIIVTGIRYFSFYALVSVVKNGKVAKVGYWVMGKSHFIQVMSNFRKLDYGPRLKLGIPGMAGKTHKKTGIRFDKKGFPKFKSIYTVKLERECYKKSREYHFYHASKKVYLQALKNRQLKSKFTKNELEQFKRGDVPSRFTWHHHQDKGVLQLVDSKIHADVNHIGGFSIWGKKK